MTLVCGEFGQSFASRRRRFSLSLCAMFSA